MYFVTCDFYGQSRIRIVELLATERVPKTNTNYFNDNVVNRLDEPTRQAGKFKCKTNK